MNAHSFLSFVQNNYDLQRANAVLSEENLKNCWKHWLTVEFLHLCNHSDAVTHILTDIHYPAEQETGELLSYLRYQSGKSLQIVNKKRLASRCDFVVSENEHRYYYELSCGSGNSLLKNQGLLKFEADITRAEALKSENKKLKINVIYAFYGAFSSQQVETFIPVDNSLRCTYLLDTGLKGSSSISRMTQMQKGGEPRLCLAVCSV